MVARPGHGLVWSEISRGSASWSVSCLVMKPRGSATWSVSCLVGDLSWQCDLVMVLSGQRSLVVARAGQCLVWSEISRGSATWSWSCLVRDLSW